MIGNVWEWVWDWHEAYPEGPATDPTGPSEGAVQVIRGGSWASTYEDSKMTTRGCAGPGGASEYIGFRLARWDDEGGDGVSRPDLVRHYEEKRTPQQRRPAKSSGKPTFVLKTRPRSEKSEKKKGWFERLLDKL